MSEDERIRKEIIEFLQLPHRQFVGNKKQEGWIAWLEKQGDYNKLVEEMKERKRLFSEERKKATSVVDRLSLGGRIATLEELLAFTKEKQGEPQPYKGNADTMRKNLIKAFKSVGSKHWGGFDVRDIIHFLESKDAIELEKQGEQKATNKIEPKFKVKYAGSEYNVLEVKDIVGVTYYGIEDEPNHIDYVQAENCERVGGYSIKENGSPYPTKPAKFSDQKHAWSEDDEDAIGMAIEALEDLCDVDDPNASFIGHNLSFDKAVEKLKALKSQSHWKPTKEQLQTLKDTINHDAACTRVDVLESLINDLKKL